MTIPLSGLYPVELRDLTGQNPQGTIFMNGTGTMATGSIDGGGGGAATVTGATTSGGNTVKQGNLYVNLAGDLTATGAQATINQLRQAISVQQYYEALARGGSRYREQVQAIWDVIISDKTVQVPEYLGGEKDKVEASPEQVVEEKDKVKAFPEQVVEEKDKAKAFPEQVVGEKE